MSEATIKKIQGKVRLFVDGEMIPPMAVCCRAYGSDEYVKGLSVDSNLRLFFIEVDSGFNDPGSYDRMFKEITSILEHRPDALFMLRTWVNPSNEWLMGNPDECVAFERPGNIDVYPLPVRAVHGVTVHRIQSIASKKWIRDLRPFLANLIQRVEKESFADRIIGYFPCALHGEEWFVPREGIMNLGWDWSPPFRNFYSEWLENKYGGDDALRESWNMPDASVATPWIVPTSERKLMPHSETAEIIRPGSRPSTPADFGYFLDPKTSMPEIDLYNAFMDATIKTIRQVAAIVKEESSGDMLTGTFYSGFGTQEYTLGGTVAPLTMLSETPEIDLLAAPFNYVDRCSGGGASFHRIPTTSLHIHDKLWFAEAEVPSWRTKPALAQYYHGDKFADEFAVLNVFKRDFASVLASDTHGWYFNNAPKTHIPGEWSQTPEDEWCNDKRIFDLFRRQQRIAETHCSRQDKKHYAEAAFVYDEKSNWCCDSESIIDLLWFSETFEYSRCGFPADRIFHQDLSSEDIPSYKLLVFVNCFSLTDEERIRIGSYLRRSGATALWLWGSGIINTDRSPAVSIRNMRELTGFDFNYESGERPMMFRVDPDTHPITAGIHSRFRFGEFRRPAMSGGLTVGGRHVTGRATTIDATLGSPLFSPKPGGDALVIGRFLCNDQPALAIDSAGKNIYHGAKILNAPLLRKIARSAGVHIWTENDDVFYCGDGFFSIHASEASVEVAYHQDERLDDEKALKKITLPVSGTVVDCYSEETIIQNQDKLLLAMAAGETRSFFYYEKQGEN